MKKNEGKYVKNDEMPDGRIGCGTRQSENDDR